MESVNSTATPQPSGRDLPPDFAKRLATKIILTAERERDPDQATEKVARLVYRTLGAPDRISLFYATINLVHYLRKDERIVSVSVCQTGEPDDFLTLGAAMGAAVDRLDRRVVLLASGGMSHAFWPLKQIPKHEASDPIHIITPEARAADEDRVELMKQGRHRDLIESMDDYMEHSPEGRFGHYLMMVGAIGGEQCSARGQLFSDYENATGTGQVHIWFERPAAGWTG